MIAPGLSPHEDAQLRLRCAELAGSGGFVDLVQARALYAFVTDTEATVSPRQRILQAMEDAGVT